MWKRGERRKAVVAGGAFAFFTFVGVAQSALSFWGVLHLPIIPSVFFTGVVIVMGLELSRDMVRAGELVSKVREGEQRLALAAEAANLGVWSREPDATKSGLRRTGEGSLILRMRKKSR